MDCRKERYIAAINEISTPGLSKEHLAYCVLTGLRRDAPSQWHSLLGRPATLRGYFANIQYGSLASRIAKYAAIIMPPDRIALNAVATWSDDSRDPRGHFAFTMRPGLAAAREEFKLTENAEAPEEGNDITDLLEGEEGEGVVRHRRREQRSRAAKIAAAIAASSGGRLRCEVPKCGFDFEAVYGAVSTEASVSPFLRVKPFAPSPPFATRM